MVTPLSSPVSPINQTQRFEDFYRLFEETPGEYKYQEQMQSPFGKRLQVQDI